MKRVVVLAPLVLGFGLVVASSSAAPGSPQPISPVAPIKPSVALPQLPKVTASLIPQTLACGQASRVRVKLVSNVAATVLNGVVIFMDGADVGLAKKFSLEGGATQELEITGKGTINCQALKAQSVKVEVNNVTVFEKTVKPVSFRMEQNFQMPADPKPWLRRLMLDAKCGAAGRVQAAVMGKGATTQEAKLTLKLGATSKDFTATLAANQVTALFMDIPAIDCGAPGIASIDYTFAGGATGTLPPQQVVYSDTSL